MKDTIIQNLTAVLNALNNITVSGKANLGNLSGSIAVVEETITMVSEMPEAKEEERSES